MTKKIAPYNKAEPSSIQTLFNAIARRYDTTNLVISFGLSKSWNRKLCRYALTGAPKNFCMLDLCSGTGEVAFECLKKSAANAKAYLLDFSLQMLKIAEDKAQKLALTKQEIHYIEADAEQIPLANASIDFTTIAYGIRNIRQPVHCFKEVMRVLKPGGKLAILELTRPNNCLLKFGHKVYLSAGLPLIGKLLTSDKQAYEYLCQSIDHFIAPEEVKKLLTQEGFAKIEVISLAGGIATILLAHKK